ncbi:MMPL family transporter [Tahibacter amnicola]|uniref:MMPL family transporter n=1 Tax=Tahibacter amnicola TaxID=2976241 RepID=A0ABY6BHZ6_9GAMM|nr:MMPL family transporter [Tahibacter amnicola]UXI68705.1 MMPL family transporter [Tahibacter amnicola]
MSTRARAGLLLLWLGVLGALLAYVVTTLRVSTDLRNFMPPARTPEQRLLLEEIGEGPGSRLLLLALYGDTPDRLAEVSKRLVPALRGDARFVRALNGDTDLSAVGDDFLPYRYLLSPRFDEHPLDADQLRDELQQRLEDLGSPAGAWIKPLLARDPTLETLRLAEAWAPPAEPERYGDVWFTRDGRSALLLVETQAAGFDPAGQSAALASLQRHLADAATGTQARWEISGPGAFTVAINHQTSTEANRIGRVDSIGFVLLLLLAYRRVGTVMAGALPLVTGGLAGMAALTLLFGGAHGITLAFGFTLIGVAQDYPIHLFSHLREGTSALAVARRLWPTLATGVASTCIAYLAFLASGVDGLEQLAVFTIVGLATAALTTRYGLSRLLGGRPHDAAQSPRLAQLSRRVAALPRPWWLAPLVGGVAIAVCIGAGRTPCWENNLAALTPVAPALVQRDAALRAELGAPDVRYLLVIEGADAETVLRRSEQLDAPLAALQTAGALDGYELPSRYLPSQFTQRARQERLPDATTLRQQLATASQELPFKTDLFAPFLADVEAARTAAPVDAARFSDSPLGLRLRAVLQSRGDHHIGLVSLIGVHQPQALAQLAATPDSAVRLLDLKQASESLVAAYRTRVLWSLAVASVLLVGVVALALRRVGRILRVVLPMALTTLVILACLRAGGVSLTLFHLVALILAAGLGLDYALFFEHVEDDEREQRRTLHAILVCSASTFLVFLLLALSTLPVLRAIGVTVTIGVVSNFILALLLSGRQKVPSRG